jgi:hypothetical protein
MGLPILSRKPEGGRPAIPVRYCTYDGFSGLYRQNSQGGT